MTKQTIHKTEYEVRNVEMSLDGVKQNADGTLFVSGYVNQTNTWSQKMRLKGRTFVERMLPGSFNKALQNGNEINFLAEHDDAKILSSTRNGSLVLREDDKGLYMEAKIAPTSWGKDYHTLIKEGIIQNMSFGMQILDDEWEPLSDGTYQRSVSDIQLFEVSAVRNPAYVQSTLSARSIDVLTINAEENTEMQNTLTLKDKRLEIIRRGKEIHKSAKAEQRSVNVFEQAELQDLETELREVEAQIESEKNEEQRAVVETPVEKRNEGPTVEQRAVASAMVGNTQTNEVRALTVNQNGSYLVPTTIANDIVKIVDARANLFNRAKEVTPINGVLKYMREKDIGSIDFVGKTEMKTMTTSDFDFDAITLDQKRIGSAVELSDKVVNNMGLNAVQYVFDFLARRVAQKTDENMLFGTYSATSMEGVIVSNDIINVNAESQTEFNFDDFIEMRNNVPEEFHKNAVWIMHPKTFGKLLKMKDDTGSPLILADRLTYAPIRKLLGFDIVFDDNMEQVGAGKRPLLFGSWADGYIKAEKKGLNFQHIWKDKQSRTNKKHLILLDRYIDGRIAEPEAFAKLTMKA